jgi:hypothetical protein
VAHYPVGASQVGTPWKEGRVAARLERGDEPLRLAKNRFQVRRTSLDLEEPVADRGGHLELRAPVPEPAGRE